MEPIKCPVCGKQLGIDGNDSDFYKCFKCGFRKGVEVMLAARIEELEAIVAKLPKTADGVVVTPGMVLWCDSKRSYPHKSLDLRFRSGETFLQHQKTMHEFLYSTEQAAREATDIRKGNNENLTMCKPRLRRSPATRHL